ncbi:MAG: hypothetical protein GQ474_01175 [Sulfurimonas sp.]|nr:hypothetical protein [Sulfurimonas sp.]
MTFAFYKGNTTFFDKVVSFWQHLIGNKYYGYSHVEIIDSNGIWYSASPRDGGVRSKLIIVKDNHWDFLDVPMSPYEEEGVLEFLEGQLGEKYDWLGIYLTMVLPLGIHSKERWFCSEFAIEALKRAEFVTISEPSSSFTPSDVYEFINSL